MDEYKQVMDEIEQRLEIALEKLESGKLDADDISIIRWACGKPSKPVAPVVKQSKGN